MKLLAFIGFVIVTVSVPASDHRRLAGCAGLLLLLTLASRIGVKELGQRLLQLTPFLLVVVLLPFARAEGSWQQLAGEIAKACIGCLALVLLAATTPVDSLLVGLGGLGCPRVLVLLLGFVVRYLHVLADEALRLRQAATARGFAPRALWHAGTVGSLAGALFLRSHARAERVQAAMLARGFDGTGVGAPAGRLHCADLGFASAVLGIALVVRFSFL